MVHRFLHWLHRAEDGLLAVLTLALLLLAVGQIVLRIGFDTGLTWSEPVARRGVLWLAMLGALGAARRHRHIAIDALPRVLPPAWRRAAWMLSQLAAAVISGLLAFYTASLVRMEVEVPVQFIAGVPSWVPMLILPAGFAVIALRLLLAGLLARPETSIAGANPEGSDP